MKIVLLNGPPRSGKDYAAELVLEQLSVKVDKFARLVKERCHAAYGLFGGDGRPLRHDFFEHLKDTPLDAFLGLTPRMAYIAFSETYMKPLHGADVFGRLLLPDLIAYSWLFPATLVTDSGFVEEARVLVDHFGASAVTLVRLRREGCSFEGDSRNYIQLPECRTLDIVNPGNKEGLERLLRENLLPLLGFEEAVR